jgi:lipopolysaccharide/colanic/teichoic acid biosynthesis glycosyltransferase
VRFSQGLKRCLDIVFAVLILIATLPILLLVPLLILILEGRPVFYLSRRCVDGDRKIPILKFRTMVRDAKSPKYRLNERFMKDGFLDVPRNCEVYTPIGRILERLQIVELPQMFNVLFYGMSLIGNRPLPEDNVKLLKKFPNWQMRFQSPAGISGIAQVVGKLRLSAPQRLALEAAYSETYLHGKIVRCDLWILFYTVRFILTSNSPSPERAFQMMASAMPEEIRNKSRRVG